MDEVIAIRTFHLSRDKTENLIHCGGGPLVLENFIDPLEAAKDGQKPKKKKDDGSKGHLDPLLLMIKTTMTSLPGTKRCATIRSPPMSATPTATQKK